MSRDSGEADAVTWMRKEMGAELARRRQGARLTQEQYAALTGSYSRAHVSHAELGTGRIARHFWEVADRLLGTGDLFAGLYDEIREVLEPGRRAAVGVASPGLRCELVLRAEQPDRALAGYRRLGWPVAAREDGADLLTGRVLDVLEVGRTAGSVAAGAWLESCGAEGALRGLPRLPPPEGSLAVIEVGAQWFFLIRPGFPWPYDSDRGSPATGEADIRWLSAAGRVPLPPSKVGPVTARWAYLPAAMLYLPPPLVVLDLLGWSVAMTRVSGRLRLPGGAVVAPASGPQ